MKKLLIALCCVGLFGPITAQIDEKPIDWSLLEATVEKLLKKNEQFCKTSYVVTNLGLQKNKEGNSMFEGDTVLHCEPLPELVQTEKLTLCKIVNYSNKELMKFEYLCVWKDTIKGIVVVHDVMMSTSSNKACHRQMELFRPMSYDNLGVISIAEMNKESSYALLPSAWREGANLLVDGAKKDPFASSQVQYEATLSPTWELLRGNLLIENFHCSYFNYVAGKKQEAQYLLREISIKDFETGEFTCLGVILEKFK